MASTSSPHARKAAEHSRSSSHRPRRPGRWKRCSAHPARRPPVKAVRFRRTDRSVAKMRLRGERAPGRRSFAGRCAGVGENRRSASEKTGSGEKKEQKEEQEGTELRLSVRMRTIDRSCDPSVGRCSRFVSSGPQESHEGVVTGGRGTQEGQTFGNSTLNPIDRSWTHRLFI